MRISDWCSDVCSSDLLADYFSSTPASVENKACANAVFGGAVIGRSGSGQAGSPSPGLRFEPQNGAQAEVKQDIGSASCRERVFQSGEISVVSVSSQTNNNSYSTRLVTTTLINH